MLRKYTEKSNIKVLVSKYVKEILEEDTKHFNIPKYDLCNCKTQNNLIKISI